jgi:hypothetical protein
MYSGHGEGWSHRDGQANKHARTHAQSIMMKRLCYDVQPTFDGKRGTTVSSGTVANND